MTTPSSPAAAPIGAKIPDRVEVWTHSVRLFHGVVTAALLTVLGAAFAKNPHAAGDVSLVENRKLAQLPDITYEGLRDGAVTRALEAFVADHFPLRERLVVIAFALKEARGLHGEQQFTATKGQENGLENLEDWAHAATEADAGVEEEDEVDAGFLLDAGTIVDVRDAGPRPDTTRIKEGVLRVPAQNGDRGLLLFRGGDKAANAFADVVNAYDDAFDANSDDVTVSLVLTPTSSAYYLPKDAEGRTLDEPWNLEVVRQRLHKSVRNADVYGELGLHLDEDIFFKSDHHWTGLGAYYGYVAWAKANGVVPLALDAFEKKTRPGTPGSLWRMTQDAALRDVDKTVDYFVPPVEVESSVRFFGEEQKQAQHQSFFVHHERGYLVWFGSDWPVMVAKTKANTGRRAVLVKNSFGNAFAPYLLSHFDVVVVVDYRYSVRSVVELAKTYGATDVILLNATSTANSAPHARRLREVLKTTGAAWETEAEKKRREEAEKVDAGVTAGEEK